MQEVTKKTQRHPRSANGANSPVGGELCATPSTKTHGEP